jgi:hypothetical protein
VDRNVRDGRIFEIIIQFQRAFKAHISIHQKENWAILYVNSYQSHHLITLFHKFSVAFCPVIGLSFPVGNRVGPALDTKPQTEREEKVKNAGSRHRR